MTDIPQDLVEKVAEVVWQNDSLRATYKTRRTLWTEAGELERKQAMSTATAAIQTLIDEGWKPPEKPDIVRDIAARAERMMPGIFKKGRKP